MTMFLIRSIAVKQDKKDQTIDALLELRAIKKEGMELFFRFEDSLTEIGNLRVLLGKTKVEKLAADKLGAVFKKIFDLSYELHDLIRGDE